MGLANLGNTRGLAGLWQGLAHQDTAGWDFGRVCNPTKLVYWSEPGPVANTSCQTIPIWREKYVLRLMKLFVHIMAANGGYTLYWEINVDLEGIQLLALQL
jgi:hypothetical protein